MPVTRPLYSPEFRRQSVGLVGAGRQPEELAKEFEPTAGSIRKWVALADKQEDHRGTQGDSPIPNGDGLTPTERDELAWLRRENKQLRVERDILSRAAAWFARAQAAAQLEGAVSSGSSGS